MLRWPCAAAYVLAATMLGLSLVQHVTSWWLLYGRGSPTAATARAPLLLDSFAMSPSPCCSRLSDLPVREARLRLCRKLPCPCTRRLRPARGCRCCRLSRPPALFGPLLMAAVAHPAVRQVGLAQPAGGGGCPNTGARTTNTLLCCGAEGWILLDALC